MSSRDFQNSPQIERLACFYVTISGNYERFKYFNFETKFLENENLSQKLEYRFLVASINTEIESFQNKTAVSKANVKKNITVSAKCTYRKERRFASNYFIFLKILFQFKTLL